MPTARAFAAIAAALALVGAVLAPALAQSGGGYDLTHNAINGGGATFSTGVPYTLGGSIGQVDAGPEQTGGAYTLRGGFWPSIVEIAPATPTATVTNTAPPGSTATATRTRTATGIATATNTAPVATATNTVAGNNATPTRTITGTVPATATATITATPGTPSPTITLTPTGGVATPTSTPVTCVGDCDGSCSVTVSELVLGVNISLGLQPISRCPAFDPNGNGSVSVAELIQAVNNSLDGCP